MFFFLMIRRPPRSTLFPNPTLSRSAPVRRRARHARAVPARLFPHERVGGRAHPRRGRRDRRPEDRKSTRLNSSHANISYAVFCLKKTKNTRRQPYLT